MTVKKTILFIFLFLIALNTIFMPKTFAQVTGVYVYPNLIEMDFTKNDKKFVTRIVNVENPLDKTLRVKVYSQNWTMNENGLMVFPDTPDDRFLNNDYVKFNPTEFDLPPKGKQIVRLTAKLPDGTDGEFRSVLFFETLQDRKDILNKKDLNLMVNFKTRLGVTLYAYKGIITKDFSVDNFTYNVIDGEPYLIITASNKGNVHTVVNANITLYSNNVPTSLNKTRLGILPGQSSKFKISLSNYGLKKANYQAKAELSYQDTDGKDKDIQLETTFALNLTDKPSAKEQLEKTDINEEIKMTPENMAKPVPAN